MMKNISQIILVNLKSTRKYFFNKKNNYFSGIFIVLNLFENVLYAGLAWQGLINITDHFFLAIIFTKK